MSDSGVILSPNPYANSLKSNHKRLNSTLSAPDGYVSDDDTKYSRSRLGQEAYSINNNPNLTPTRASSTSLYHHYSQDIKPHTGCILLGKDGETGNKYTTRFKVDMAEQRAIAEKGVFKEECFLCCDEENRSSFCSCLISVVMSEAFLLTFHLTALTLGVAKYSIKREEVDHDLELIHSILEVLVVTFVLFARCMLIHRSNKSISGYLQENHHIDTEGSIDGKRLRRLAWLFYALAIMLDIVTIVIAVLFYFVLHLGWTTLINNAVLIIATVASNLILKKFDNIRAAIIEDEHKVVLYEATLLLNEGKMAVTDEQRKAYFRKVTRYIRSLMDTKSFRQPSHIELMDKYGPRWNTVTTMEVMSAV